MNVKKSGLPLSKKSVDNALFLLHVFFSLFEPVALALNIDDGAVVRDTVENRGSDGNVDKDFVPLRKGLVICIKRHPSMVYYTIDGCLLPTG